MDPSREKNQLGALVGDGQKRLWGSGPPTRRGNNWVSRTDTTNRGTGVPEKESYYAPSREVNQLDELVGVSRRWRGRAEVGRRGMGPSKKRQ